MTVDDNQLLFVAIIISQTQTAEWQHDTNKHVTMEMTMKIKHSIVERIKSEGKSFWQNGNDRWLASL